jgi:hypothetical protein
MPTRIISMVTQLHQFIIVFSFKLKTFIGSRAGSLLTFNSPLAKPLNKKAKPQQSVSLFTCKKQFQQLWVGVVGFCLQIDCKQCRNTCFT